MCNEYWQQFQPLLGKKQRGLSNSRSGIMAYSSSSNMHWTDVSHTLGLLDLSLSGSKHHKGTSFNAVDVVVYAKSSFDVAWWLPSALCNVRLDNSSDQTPFLLSSPTHKDSSGNQTWVCCCEFVSLTTKSQLLQIWLLARSHIKHLHVFFWTSSTFSTFATNKAKAKVNLFLSIITILHQKQTPSMASETELFINLQVWQRHSPQEKS